jgi:hypothetical protein
MKGMPSVSELGTQETDQQRAERLARELAALRAAASREHIAKIATRMGFRDPEDVVGRVSAEDALSDYFIEEALRGIAERSPHLVAPPAPPSTPDGKPLIRTIEDWEALPTEAERQACMPELDSILRVDTPVSPGPKPPLRSLAEWEALPQVERQARLDEADALLLAEMS